MQAEAAAETAIKKRRRKTKSSFKQLELPDFRTIKKRRNLLNIKSNVN